MPKMLKEVAELRGWIRASCKAENIRDYHALVLVDKAVRAVREECAKVAEDNNGMCDCGRCIAAAIRLTNICVYGRKK